MAAGRDWLKDFKGKRVLQSYARWFGIDLGCALKELQLLGFQFDSNYLAAVRVSIASRRHVTFRRATGTPEIDSPSDAYFAFVAGYTEGGLPYGVTWEEPRNSGSGQRSPSKIPCGSNLIKVYRVKLSR
jgi:hypothetical protein